MSNYVYTISPEWEYISRVYFCYSNENIKSLIEKNYKLITNTEDYFLSSVSELDSLPKDSFKIIFTDDLMIVSDYICIETYENSLFKLLTNKKILIININKNTPLLNSFAFSKERRNIVNLDYKSNDFEEYLKWLILLFSSAPSLSGRTDVYDIADWCSYIGISTLTLRHAEGNNIDNVINKIIDNDNTNPHYLFVLCKEFETPDIDDFVRARDLYFRDLSDDIHACSCVGEANFNLGHKFVAISIIPYSYQKS